MKSGIDEDTRRNIGKLLDAVDRASGRDQVESTAMAAITAIEELPLDLQIRVVQKAVGNGMRRWRAAADVFGRCRPSTQIDEWIVAALNQSDDERRDWMIQIVAFHRLARFAGEINRIIREDGKCRHAAISAAGDLHTDANCAELVRYAESLGGQDIPRNLLISLSRFESEAVRPFLRRAFDGGWHETNPYLRSALGDSDEEYRVFAAWGLGRLGDRQSIEYLVRMLDDTDGRDNTASLAARRAAQALSDLFNWSLEWTPEAPAQAKERWQHL